MDTVSGGSARVARVNGPLVEVTGLTGVAMYDIIELGEHLLPGEAVAIRGDVTTVQAYEYTGGLAPGDPARSRGEPLSARLGPHLLGGIFDGLLRPLDGAPAWLEPGHVFTPAEGAEFEFTPQTEPGTAVGEGASLGSVAVSGGIGYRVLVPPGLSGVVEKIRDAGPAPGDAVIATVSGTDVSLTSSVAGAAPPAVPAAAGRPELRCSPGSAWSTCCSRSRRAVAAPSPAGSAPARPCCCSRSRNGATRT